MAELALIGAAEARTSATRSSEAAKEARRVFIERKDDIMAERTGQRRKT
jgi:hypothetical protein